MTSDATARCPSCGAELAPDTVLCVACGYHLKLGRRLEPEIQAEPPPAISPPVPGGNPYASPSAEPHATTLLPGETPEFDLTKEGARRAQAIVNEAKSIPFVIIAAWCFCAPAWLIMLPWYSYRLYSWYSLNAQFAELHHPNSLSPNGELAIKFKDSLIRLWIGVAAGLVFWVFLAAVIAIDLSRLFFTS